MQFSTVMQQVEGINFQRSQLLRDRQQRHPHLGQLDTSAPAMKQLHIMLLFQPLYLFGHSGLGHSQGAGPGAETAMTGNSQEGAQACGGHIDSIYR
jgi:hypothetical protein